jgi:HK97 family phage prohead protease
MKDASKKFGAELAAEIAAHFGSDEVKQLLASTKDAPDASTGTFEVVITTADLDRYQEVISLDGWQLDNYRANPIVLWAHDHREPIGVATDLSIADGKMIAKGKFAPNAKGQEIRQLYDAGIIRATSVGFIEKERQGNLITKAELLEFSFVSVPANPYALALAMEKEFNVNELVTKGFMVVEKDGEAEPTEPQETVEETVPESEEEAVVETPAEEVQETEEHEATEEERAPAGAVAPVIASLKAAISALEALEVANDNEEPEGGDEAPTEEARQLAEFTAARRTLQGAATVLGEVLAEMRQTAEAAR